MMITPEQKGIAGCILLVALAEIEPLVLSEVMRDIDLFVGVSSVGNDPSWGDSGPEGKAERPDRTAIIERARKAAVMVMGY